MPVQRSASRVAIATKKSLTQDENVNPSKMGASVSASSSACALNMTINDVTCPICLEIFIEPISLPCNHELCLQCFNSMTNFETFECPMCRARLATWARTARVHNQKLVNEKRWSDIKKAFPVEVKNKVEGKSAQIVKESLDKLRQGIIDSTNRVGQKCAQPGEIRQEYLDYLKREEERIRKEKEAEERESIEYIQKLIRQEENVSFDDYMFMLNTINRPSSSSNGPASSSSTLNSVRVLSAASTPNNLQPTNSTSSTSSNSSNTVNSQQNTANSSSGPSTSGIARQISDNETPILIRESNVPSSSSSNTSQQQSQSSRVNDVNKKTPPKRPADGEDSSDDEQTNSGSAPSTSGSAPATSRPNTRSRHEITPSTSENAANHNDEVKLTASARLLRRNSSRRAPATNAAVAAQTVMNKSAEQTLNTYGTLQRANKKSKLARITEATDKKNSSLNLASASQVNNINQSQLSTSTTSVMSIDEEEFRRNLRPRANKQTNL